MNYIKLSHILSVFLQKKIDFLKNVQKKIKNTSFGGRIDEIEVIKI